VAQGHSVSNGPPLGLNDLFSFGEFGFHLTPAAVTRVAALAAAAATTAFRRSLLFNFSLLFLLLLIGHLLVFNVRKQNRWLS
jgi:hypothetical protein